MTESKGAVSMDVNAARELLVRGNGVPRRPDKVEQALSEALDALVTLQAENEQKDRRIVELGAELDRWREGEDN